MPEVRPPTVGWRAWKMDPENDGLTSLYRDYIWPDHATAGPAEHLGSGMAGPWPYGSIDKYTGPHTTAPWWNRKNDRVCTCGYNAYDSLARAFEREKNKTQSHSSSFVIGAVLMWGRRVEYTEGLRAQYATALLLVDKAPGRFWCPKQDKPWMRYATGPNAVLPFFNEEGWKERVEKRCARYNVPLVPEDIAEDWAYMSGDPLPNFGAPA